MSARTFDLKEIVRNCIKLEGPEPEVKGSFLRLLLLSANLADQEIVDLLLYNAGLLAKSKLLESAEFHEGLGQVIRPRDMIVTLVDTYSDKRQSQLAPVIAKLCGDGYLRPTGDDWDIIRLRVSDVDFRNLIVKVIELRGNGLKGSMKFLLAVFRPGENFEVSECVRLILDSSWVLDFLPSKKKKTREMLNDVVVKVIPFARKVVDDFVIDYLGLEPLPSDTPLVEDIASASSSSGSDMESKGSLEDFVVDEDEDDEGEIYSSDSSSASSSSDDDNNRRRPVKKLKTTTIEQDESSSSSSSSSSSESSDN